MILPQSYLATLILMIFGMLCLGSWANTFKMGGKWRFELYYFDFALGVLVVALLLAFTVGSLGFDGFSFNDDLMHAGKRQWFYAFVAGVIFNFANMLLMAAISVAGMSVAFPLGIGCAMVIGSLLTLIVRGTGSPALLLAGCLAIVIAMILNGAAYRTLGVLRHEAIAKAGKASSTRRPSSAKGIILSVVSGLLIGSVAPLMQSSMVGELGLGAYSVIVVFAIAVFFSTFAFNMFFVNLAVEGEPVEISEFFRARPKLHLLGFSGGAVWTIGATAALVASAATEGARLHPATSFALSQGFAVIAALWGLVAWREFRGSNAKVKILAVLMLVAYIGGLALLSFAPLYVRKG